MKWNNMITYSPSILIIFIVVVTPFSESSSGTLNLTNQSLERIPPKNGSIYQKMYLTSNNIQEINRGSFNGYGALIFLDLTNNNISKLGDRAFDEAIGLEELDLSENPLVTINAAAFSDTQLVRVSFQSCSLEWIDPDLGGLSHLTEFNLRRNLLIYIPKAMLNSLIHLKILDLSHNKIESLHREMFSGPERLERIDLSNNVLSELPLGSFAGLTELKTLDVSNNRFTSTIDLMISSRYTVQIWAYNFNLDSVPQVTCTSNSTATVMYIGDNKIHCTTDFSEEHINPKYKTTTYEGRKQEDGLSGSTYMTTVQPDGFRNVTNGMNDSQRRELELPVPNNNKVNSVLVTVVIVISVLWLVTFIMLALTIMHVRRLNNHKIQGKEQIVDL